MSTAWERDISVSSLGISLFVKRYFVKYIIYLVGRLMYRSFMSKVKNLCDWALEVRNLRPSSFTVRHDFWSIQNNRQSCGFLLWTTQVLGWKRVKWFLPFFGLYPKDSDNKSFRLLVPNYQNIRLHITEDSNIHTRKQWETHNSSRIQFPGDINFGFYHFDVTLTCLG